MRPGRAADHSPPSSAAVVEEYSYTSIHPLGHTGPVTGTLYRYLLLVYVQTAIQHSKNKCLNQSIQLNSSIKNN